MRQMVHYEGNMEVHLGGPAGGGNICPWTKEIFPLGFEK